MHGRVLFPLLTVLGVAFLITACSNVLEIPTISFSAYQQTERINLSVELSLTEEFRTAKSERMQDQETIIFPLGDNLVVNAETLARAIFADVSIVTDNSDVKQKQVDAVLVPRMVSSQRLSPISAFVKQPYKIAVVLEWTMKDREDNLIWLDTVTAEGKVFELGFNREENRKKLITSLIENLFQNSYDALSSSPEIRNLAGRRSSS